MTFVLGVTVVVLVLSSLPYLYGYVSCPDELQFMGIAWKTFDTTQYFSWMRGFATRILISNTMTPEPNEAVFFNLQWFLLGRFAIYTGLSYPQVFQIFRLVAGAAFLLVAYPFCSLLLTDITQRKTAYLLVVLGSGFGWLLVVAKQFTGQLEYPMDVYAIEPNTFASILAFPHFLVAASLMLSVYTLDILGYEKRQWRYPTAAGFIGLVLGFMHAYDLLLIYAVLLAFSIILFVRDGWSCELLLYPGVIIAISCFPAFYSVYITSAFPVWKAVLAQFANAGAWTPNPFHLLIVLGVPFIIALVTFDGLVPLKDQAPRTLFLKVWFGVNFFIVYLPVNYQIHYLNGWQVPISILATVGFFTRIVPWLQQSNSIRRILSFIKCPENQDKRALVLAGIFVLAALPTNIYLFTWRFVDLGRHSHPYYLYRDEVRGLEWLRANSSPDEVVLSGLVVGRYIPNVAGKRAFLAHWAMTADVYRKQELIQEFFDPATSNDQRRRLVEEYGIGYIFYGSEERALGQFVPDRLPFVERAFVSPHATVYRVRLDQTDQVCTGGNT